MNPHLQSPTIYGGAPVSSNNPIILAFHGRGQTPDVVVDIFERLQWNDASLVAPSAADNSWYPAGFMADIKTNEPFLSDALAVVAQSVANLAVKGVKKENIILLGFSQGACLVAEYAIRQPQRYGGIVIFTGGVIGPAGTQWSYDGSFEGTPTLITTGDKDEWVPVERVHETAILFNNANAAVTKKVFTDREHLVSDEEIKMAQTIFK